MKAVLFDLDGTLLDTLHDIADSCNAALARHNLPAHPVEGYKKFVGDGVQVLITRTVPAARQDPQTLASITAAYRQEYHRRWNATTTPYPGITELLRELGRRKIPLAVFSNKPDDFTRRCVTELLAGLSFAVVLGASGDFPPKPDPGGALHIARHLKIQPGEFLYLGDTGTDMRTAVAAGMFPVGALWGFRAAEELQQAGAQRLIKHPLELLDLLPPTQ